MATQNFCVHCGAPVESGNEFCPKCGKPVTQQATTSTSASPATGSRGGFDKRLLLVIALVFIVLVVPVFPRDRIVYVDGQTQTVTQSTSYATSFQTYTTQSDISIKVYKGSLKTVSDTYYYYYQQYYQNCYVDSYGNVYCYYNQWPNYNQYGYTNSITIDPSDNVVKLDQTQESGGLWTITLTHYDGTADTYRHVFSTDMTKTATSTVQGTVTMTNTITNTIVNPVTSNAPCQQCIPQHVTDHVSILQMLLGY